jgi:RNA polymerase sigma factor (sigma-70 family)
MMGTKAPFERVVADYGPTVLRVCQGVLGSHPDGEDAWGETFLVAMRAYPELPTDANVEAWLVTIAHRKAIDVTRARRRRPVPMGELPDGPSPDGVPRNVDDELRGAVMALPPRQRQAVVYHYLGGLPYREVAGILGGSAEAARRAAADGIKRLRLTPLLMSTRGGTR